MSSGQGGHDQSVSGGATLLGFGAILLWSSLTALSRLVEKVPAMQLTFITFTMAFVLALCVWKARGEAIKPKFGMSWLQWVVGVPSVAGNIVFFYYGTKHAPLEQAQMLNYLWPLELVLMASLLPGQKMKWEQMVGVVLGAIGIMVLFLWKKEGGSGFKLEATWGYLASLGGGLCWAWYSVFRRATANKAGSAGGSDAIMMFVGGTAVLTAVMHFMFETWYSPVSVWEWVGLVLLAAGPTYGAYGLWEIGIKKGNIRLLGVGSFLIPLMSTGLLVMFGFASYSHALLVSCLLIVSGAAVASIEALRKTGEKVEK